MALQDQPRVLVMISGSGSNLQALMDAKDPSINITHVVSNRKAAYGLTRASIHEPPIPTSVFAMQPYLTKNPGKTRENYDEALAELIMKETPDLIVCAGWMHILSSAFLQRIKRKTVATEADDTQETIPIINLHPALPGAFDGINAIARAHEAFEKGEIENTGVMVHKVIDAVDKGEPIVVKKVEMVKGESIEALEARMHAVEHEILVEAVQKLCLGMRTGAITKGIEQL